MNFMIGCSVGGLYGIGQVIYNNPSNDEKSFTICKWDKSLAGKTLAVYSHKYNTTYNIRIDEAGKGSYSSNTYPELEKNIDITLVSDYLMCDNSWLIIYFNIDDYADGSLQITKITIVE